MENTAKNIVRRLHPLPNVFDAEFGDQQFLQVVDGYLEIRLKVGMTWTEWCKKIGEKLCKSKGSYLPCALLTGNRCSVFIHEEGLLEKIKEELGK